MNIKIVSSIAALALGVVSGGIVQAATETERSYERSETSTTVEVPRVSNKVVEEQSTTTTKRGLFGRKKSETTHSSSVRYDGSGNAIPRTVTSTEVKSRTRVETDR